MSAYHHVYIKHNKEPRIPQQKPEWEMTRPNEFQEFFTHFRPFKFMILNQPEINYFISMKKQKPCSYGETNL